MSEEAARLRGLLAAAQARAEAAEALLLQSVIREAELNARLAELVKLGDKLAELLQKDGKGTT